MNKKNYTTWFQHDSNAMNNRNLKAMRSVYGMEGVGCWWTLQEILSTQPGYKLNISDEYAMSNLAGDLGCEYDLTERFINDCINKFHLLQCDETHLWSPELIQSMQPLEEKRAVLSEKGKKGAKAMHEKRLAQATDVDDTGIAQASKNMTKKSKEEKSKEKNNYPEGNINTPLVDNTMPIPIPRNDGLADIALLMQRVLTDDIHFCSYHIRPGALKDKQALEGWLTAFNKWLRYGGEHIRNENSYRVHFKNWIVRQDLRKNPLTYDPVTDTTTPYKKANIPLEMPRKTAQQALAEREAAEKEFINQSKAI
jgi:hypothetical protein